MLNANRTRAILAQQKIKQQIKPQPLPDNYQLGKLTAEERKLIYAPKPASEAPQHLRGNEWVNAWRTVERITYGITAIGGLLFGGLIASESKKSIRQ